MTNEKELEERIYSDSNRVLLEYLKREYRYLGGEKLQSTKNKIDLLSKLDKPTLEYGIIRMKTIIDTYDISKLLAPIITMIIAIVSAYSSVLTIVEKKTEFSLFINIFPLALLLVFYLYISKKVGETNSSRAEATYFMNLLEYELKRKNTDEKKKLNH